MARSMKEVHTINYYPINEGAARRAKEMNSFSDYKEGSATAEFTYAVLGCVVGCAIGLPLSKSLYDFLIAGHFPSAVWQFPIISLGVILLFVSIAAIAAVYAPAKRIRNMSITATINEL